MTFAAGSGRHAIKSMVALLLALAAGLAVPGAAQAHGPVNPVASDYLARVSQVPAGLAVKVVDGDQAMWLRAPASTTVVVLDPRGAPYLRFSAAGEAVNQNSELYYLNQTPVALTPPPGLSAATPTDWHRVSSGHSYLWHEGRLHALAALAISPSTSYVGRWTVPVLVDGRRTVIAGGVWHTGAPSLAWLWPIVVLVLSLLAVRRLRDPVLDRRAVLALGLTTLLGIALAAAGRDLHGRPGISAFGAAELAVTLALVAWATWRLLGARVGFLLGFAIAFVGLYEGIVVFPALDHGYVLLALGPLVGRLSAVLCLGGGIGLLLSALRVADTADTGETGDPDQDDIEEDFGVAPSLG